MKKQNVETDVVVIGGGVVGTAIARELSKFNLDIILLEKEDDVAMGTSKANSGIIHAGYNADGNTLKGRLNVKANLMFDELCEDLQVPFKRIGSLVVGFTDRDLKILKKEKENGTNMGVEGLEIIDRDKLFNIEPNINPDARFALYAPTAGIISAYEFTIALADSAVINGADVFLNEEVKDIVVQDNTIYAVKTNNKIIRAAIVINAAGLFSDKIAKLVGENNYNITPRKGEYHLYDKKWGDFVKHVLFPIPTKVSKGILITPTAHGNLMVGPNSLEIEKKDDLATTGRGLDEVFHGAKKLIPSLKMNGIITSFAGIRAAEEREDFIIESSNKIKGMVNLIGIQSPGLASSPAIAVMVRDIVREVNEAYEFNLDLSQKRNFMKKLPERPVFNEYSDNDYIDTWQKKIDKRKDYGEIICRCENVTKGEIIDAIHRPVPAKSLDAVKRRTRAGTGRCQGGFCGPRVLEILAEELGISHLNVTKKGRGSEVLVGKNKEFILNKAGDTDEE